MNKCQLVVLIVTFNPNMNSLLLMLDSFVNGEVIYIGNNSDYALEFDSEYLKQQNLMIYNFGENLGIARAQSILMERAFSSGADYIIQFDQDSKPEVNYCDRLVQTYNSLIEKDIPVGILGPQYVLNSEDPNCVGVVEKSTVISSGSLISRDVYNKVGGMLDSLFIDFVDHEYCWRLKKYGFKVFMDTRSIVKHELGDGVVDFLGLKICKCAPFRHYYVLRNGFYLLKVNYVPLSWKLKFICKLPLNILFAFKLGNTKERLKFMCYGLVDGLSGVLGEFNRET